MNKRFLEALTGALAGGVAGGASAFITEPSKNKRNEALKRRIAGGAIAGGIGLPALNIAALKGFPLIREKMFSKLPNMPPPPDNPGAYFMGGLRGVKQEMSAANKIRDAISKEKFLSDPRNKGLVNLYNKFRKVFPKESSEDAGFEKTADYTLQKKKPYAGSSLGQEIQERLKNGEGMSDERIQSLISDFSAKVGDPGNVVINREVKPFGGKVFEYKEDSKLHKGLKSLPLKPGTNVISEPVESLLVNSMAHATDPLKDQTLSRIKNLARLRNAMIVTNLAGKLIPHKNLRKAVRTLALGTGIAAQVAKHNESYKSNQRANEVVKQYLGYTEDDVENDPILYKKLKAPYSKRNFELASALITMPDINYLTDLPE